MKINKKHVRLLEKLITKGYQGGIFMSHNHQKKIAAITIEEILDLPVKNIAELREVEETKKAIGAKKLFEYLLEDESEEKDK